MWTDWETIKLSSPFPIHSLQETLDGGQAFRWNKISETDWQGIWSSNLVRLRALSPTKLAWSAPRKEADRIHANLISYLSLDNSLEKSIDQLPWRSDPHLHRCLKQFPGLRLLKQPLEETLLTFLCSATKQIVQIKQMCELLAQNIGVEIYPGIRRLPTWKEIEETSEKQLRECALGFRAGYIFKVAQLLKEQPDFLHQIELAPYPLAKEHLMTLPGVGEKVADCVLLFGAQKQAAFPVDTWIAKTLERRYHLSGWDKKQLTQFGQIHFGQHAGLAQQYLFAWERAYL
jgi:N-glycosylase/DNA lyase